jgi:peroxin-5
MQTADGLIKSVSDPTIKATDFMKYVEKLSSGEVKLNSSNGQDQDASLQWADEYDFQFGTTDASSDWANSFAGQEDLGPGPSAQQTTNAKADFWQNLEEEWERLAQEDAAAHPWLAERTSELNQAYTFNETNPFREAINPLEEGKIRLREGDLPSAVLAFEAAVQKSPDNPECWLLLGSTQAQNEQDPLAISALNKCLELEPNNLSGLMNLAASLTNESYQLQACNALKNWLRYNPKYSHLVPDDIPSPTNSGVSTMLPSSELNHVQKLFVKAARLNPATSVDADVQSGLGILFNLSSDYDRAADCFQAALSVTPNDSLLWNRMGATLANGGKSTEAIGAYRRALEISPGFIRTRYNLGISCVNLGAYREAAEHFLSSLNQQAAGRPSATGNSVNSKSNVVSNSIWASLRMILHLMDRSELSPAVDSRDLSRLNREFNIQQ